MYAVRYVGLTRFFSQNKRR